MSVKAVLTAFAFTAALFNLPIDGKARDRYPFDIVIQNNTDSSAMMTSAFHSLIISPHSRNAVTVPMEPNAYKEKLRINYGYRYCEVHLVEAEPQAGISIVLENKTCKAYIIVNGATQENEIWGTKWQWEGNEPQE